MFTGPQIRKLSKDDAFDKHLFAMELQAWKGLTAVIQQFLGSNRAPNYKKLVEDIKKTSVFSKINSVKSKLIM